MLTGADGHWDEDAKGGIGTGSAGKIHKVSLWSISSNNEDETYRDGDSSEGQEWTKRWWHGRCLAALEDEANSLVMAAIEVRVPVEFTFVAAMDQWRGKWWMGTDGGNWWLGHGRRAINRSGGQWS